MNTWWGRSLALALLSLSACTQPNPKSCLDGTCPTEEYPFCDVDGSFAELPGTCIAVACEANAFSQCRGNTAITCNATGNDYDLLQCELGCQEGVGCRVCLPNQTVCTNGAVQSCDAGGHVSSSEPCALGCFDDEPRCSNISPSNGLGGYADLALTLAGAEPADIELNIATIDVETGGVYTSTGPVEIPNTLVPAPAGGVPIRVFAVGNLVIGHVDFQRSNAALGTLPAVAFVASGDVTVEGPINLDGYEVVPGTFTSETCSGKRGFTTTLGGVLIASGAGGGGHATQGGIGGGVGNDDILAPRPGGLADGTAELVPLRGGCAGGIAGGGAIQISARGKITVLGTIDVRGGGDRPAFGPEEAYIAGGGAGGGILLEGATVELGPMARLLALGGPGASGADAGTFLTIDAPQVGGPSSGMYVGSGGNGASSTIGATNGQSVPFSTSVTFASGGGGGGGVGRVRVNTVTGTYTKANSAVEAAVATSGVVRTR